MVNRKAKMILLWKLLLIAHQADKVGATSLLAHHGGSTIRFANDRALLPPISSHTLLSVRGGGPSESASAWSAGSKYDYRTSPQFSQSQSTQRYQTPSSYTQVQDAKAAVTEDSTKEAFADAFLQREDRNRFISRVYAILSAQLLFTAGTIHAFHLNPAIRDYMFFHPFGRKVPMIGLGVSSIAWMIMLLSTNTQRSSPMRWPLLVLFTLGESVAVGFISSVYSYSSVMKAMSLTGLTTLSVTVYTLLQKNPKYDLSQWGRALAGLGMAFLLYGLVHVLELVGVLPSGFLPYSEAIFGIFGATLFSAYLAYHTRLIVSGKSTKYQMNEKDYILGAMSLYSDIVNIFLYILRILGDIDDK